MAVSWLPLREELKLFNGPIDHNGSPTWVMQDPASQRFFRFDWQSLEILRRWHLGNPEAIAKAISDETTLQVDDDDVMALFANLHSWELLQVSDAGVRQHWQQKQARKSGWRWLLNNYLYLRIPLTHPQAWLDRWGPRLQFLFSRNFWLLTAMAGGLGLYLTSQQWSRFVSTFNAYSDWQGALNLFLALAVVKCFHEMGHALTVHRFGCRVPSMGVVFLVLWPVLYTDTSEAWTLRSRRQRLAVGAAGMLAEAMVASWALLAWHVMPEGKAQAACFFLSTSALVMSLAFNLNPMMRFDGYFLISDFFDQPNLHERAFRMARWWLRGFLWGLDEPQPEPMPLRMRVFMVAFAWTIWLYRLVVFFGIALLVYHFFIKTLGIFLMLVEIGVFIVRPVVSEVLHWWKHRGVMQMVQRVRTSAVLLLILAPFVIPWSTTLRLPAVHGGEIEREIQLSDAAQLKTLNVVRGSQVRAGDVLAVFSSPEIENQLSEVLQERTVLQWQMDHQGFDSELLSQGQTLSRRFEENLAREINLKAQLDHLTLTAQVEGEIVDMIDGLTPGTWLQKNMTLMRLVSPQQHAITGWISEQDLGRLQAGTSGRFVPEPLELAAVECPITRVDQAIAATLNEPIISSEFGGPLPVRRVEKTLVPEGAWYKVQLSGCGTTGSVSKTRGTLFVSAKAESLLSGFVRRMLAVIRREAGQGY